MAPLSITRRSLLRTAAAGGLVIPRARAESLRLATFTVEVTPPLGHPLLAGLYEPALKIEDPLYVKGLILLGPEKPAAVVAVDFCEIRTIAYEEWKSAVAEAAGTDPERVLLTSLHQHDTPILDTLAQKILKENGIAGNICDPAFHTQCVRKTAQAAREALRSARAVTHFGTGQAKVDRVASNRRAELADGKVVFRRNSTTRDAAVRTAPEGLVDPYLKTLSFWDGQRPLAALSCYSVHAQTHFGKGGVTSDFTGLARAKRQQETPGVFQMYAAGCSGDTTVGKYNDGDPKNILLLGERLREGMAGAFQKTERHTLKRLSFRSVPLPLSMNDEGDFAEAAQKRLLAEKSQRFQKHSPSAMGLGWRRRAAQGYTIQMPVLDLGGALLVLAPGETFVQYQLWAQQMRPDAFVMVLGYGECAPGYIPTRKAVAEGWKEDAWSWSHPEASEEIMLAGLKAALRKE